MKHSAKLFSLQVAYLFMAQVTYAQGSVDNPIIVNTYHPDFNISVSRCVARGNTVILDLVFMNEGDSDVKVQGFYPMGTSVVDSDGNIYQSTCSSRESLYIKLANMKGWTSCTFGIYNFELIPGVPTKASIKLEGVPFNVERLARVKLAIRCDDWGLESYDASNKAEIRNIPIYRK